MPHLRFCSSAVTYLVNYISTSQVLSTSRLPAPSHPLLPLRVTVLRASSAHAVLLPQLSRILTVPRVTSDAQLGPATLPEATYSSPPAPPWWTAPVVPLHPPFLLLPIRAPQSALGWSSLESQSCWGIRKELNPVTHLISCTSNGTVYHPQPVHELSPPGRLAQGWSGEAVRDNSEEGVGCIGKRNSLFTEGIWVAHRHLPRRKPAYERGDWGEQMRWSLMTQCEHLGLAHPENTDPGLYLFFLAWANLSWASMMWESWLIHTEKHSVALLRLLLPNNVASCIQMNFPPSCPPL